MVPEGTPGKWTLLATHPDKRQPPDKRKPIVESYATFSGARERKADLKQAGYTVEISLSEPQEGG
jgi:hypothetical protein